MRGLAAADGPLRGRDAARRSCRERSRRSRTTSSLAILGTTPNYPSIRRNVKLLDGRFLDDEDVLQRAKVCVVNRPLYEELFGAEPAGARRSGRSG